MNSNQKKEIMHVAEIMEVVPHYVEYDLLERGAVKAGEIESLIEYFDFSREKKIGYVKSDTWTDLYSFLTLLRTRDGLLSDNGVYLLMQEVGDRCSIVISRDKHSTKRNDLLFLQFFEKDEWANVEEVFILMGLHMIERVETCRRVYRYHEADIIVESAGNTHRLIVKARTLDELIEGVTTCGYSIDRAKVFIPPCRG